MTTRFASDSLSWPVWLRVLLTLPFVAGAYVLGKGVVAAVTAGRPGAALLPFLLGIFLVYAVPFLRGLWRPSTSWRHDRLRAETAAERIADRARHLSPGTDGDDVFGATFSGGGPMRPHKREGS
jgi:hypothetical protein